MGHQSTANQGGSNHYRDTSDAQKQVKMKAASLFIIGTTLALVLALLFFVEPAEARKGSGSSSSTSSRISISSSSGGSKKIKNPKPKVKNKLKEAAVVGAVFYTAYKLGKLKRRFGLKTRNYKFDDWNEWRRADGFLCRTTDDCNWVDTKLYCQNQELDFAPRRAWFGGNFFNIRGKCACPLGMVFDDEGSRPSMKCVRRSSGQNGTIHIGVATGMTGAALILAILTPLGCLACCVCAGFVIARKMMH